MSLTERQMERYCDVLIWALKTARKGRFQKNDVILIRYDLAAIRMAEILQAKVLDMGMNAIPRMGLTWGMERSFFEKANNRQLVFLTPGEKELFSHVNGSVYLYAPGSLTHLSHIDPKRMGKAAVARKPLREILDKRDEQGRFGWSLCMVPTPALARHAKLSMKQYTAQVIRACYLHRKDPVKEWKGIYKNGMAIKKWINNMKVKHYHVESRSVDLKITPGKNRKWVGLSGHNIPSFEIFLSPDWRGTEGVYFANQPSFRSGNYVEGVRIEFRKGNASSITAQKGKDFVVKQLSMDPGAKRVGEFSLTDKRFSKIDKFMANTLYDENYGGRYGNCHVALGSSYSNTYAGDASRLTKEKKKNLGFNDSALHWDLVNTEEKRVTAYLRSGQKIVVYENGMFRY